MKILYVSQDEFDALRGEDFDIRYDDEVDYEDFGQWRFMNDDEDDIENWLDIYRNTGNKELPSLVKKNSNSSWTTWTSLVQPELELVLDQTRPRVDPKPGLV